MIFDFLHQRDAVAAEQKYEQSVPKRMKYSIESNGKRISKIAPNILEKDKAEIIDRKILDYSFNIGSTSKYPGDVHGLGVGYFGLLLEGKDNSRPEWMVIAIGSAANFYSLLDGRWIEAFYTEKD